MSEQRQTDITPEDPETSYASPDELRGGTSETPDQPLGTPAEGESQVEGMPGIPDREPPQDA